MKQFNLGLKIIGSAHLGPGVDRGLILLDEEIDL